MNIEKYADKHPKTRPGAILAENIETIARLPVEAKILDIGCAEGNTIQWLRARFPDRFSLYGLDLSQTRIGKAAKKQIPGAVFSVGNACDLPVKNASVDFVTASQIIEHVPDDRLLLREAARVLVPGGKFQIDSVYKKKWARYFYQSPSGWALDPTHLREYTDMDGFLSLFPPSLKITGVVLIKSYRRLNIIRKLAFLPDWVKFRVPGYFAVYVSGEKI
jgi:SAM-dependent methyltransferase